MKHNHHHYFRAAFAASLALYAVALCLESAQPESGEKAWYGWQCFIAVWYLFLDIDNALEVVRAIFWNLTNPIVIAVVTLQFFKVTRLHFMLLAAAWVPMLSWVVWMGPDLRAGYYVWVVSNLGLGLSLYVKYKETRMWNKRKGSAGE